MPLYGRAPVCVARPSKTHDGAGGRPKVRDNDSPINDLAVRAGETADAPSPRDACGSGVIAPELKKAP